MRITNSMITRNTKSNINSNKLLVDKYNTQMTTQKKISKASENPVIAIRSLRLSTTMSHINQYVDNNIPDASAWMDVTETALTNMISLLRDIRTQCVNGSTDAKNADDRKIILDNLKSLAEQVYTEGNADYAGKSVFTGYRTSSTLTFEEDEVDTTYRIKQEFNFDDLEEKRYYTGDVIVPEALTNTVTECTTTISENSYERIRFAYNGDTELNNLSYTIGGVTTDLVTTDDAGNVTTAANVSVYETEAEWETQKQAAGLEGKVVGDDEVVYIKETGELIFGKEIANTISDGRASISAEYTKKGFDEGELKPEYYYDCVDITDDDPTKHVEYTKENQDINYTIANNTSITINTQASDVFDSDIKRDVDELINVVQKAIDTNDKVTKLESMMKEAQYQDEDSQAMLQTYLDAAKKEADLADDNLQKTYEQYITRFDGYLESVNIANTNVGSMKNRLTMTQTRVENQQTTIEELKSQNEDRDISDIIIDYYASYNAYQSSLTAAGKLGERTLLDYI